MDPATTRKSAATENGVRRRQPCLLARHAETGTWPEAIDELESFDYSVTDARHVKTSALPGIHDDIVMASPPASPVRSNPSEKVDPRVLRSTPGQLPKPRRAGFRMSNEVCVVCYAAI